MPTFINNPGDGNGSGTNLVLGIILAIIILGGIALFLIYGLPMMQSDSSGDSDSIDVNIELQESVTPNPDNE